MNEPTSCPPRARALSLLTSLSALAVAAVAPAQYVVYNQRNGSNLAYCGATVGGPGVFHSFLTTAPVNDSIAVSDPGTATTAQSAASATFVANATQAGIAVAVSGTAMRTLPPGFVAPLADGRDTWTFTTTTPVRFTLDATLSATSTEATVPPCHFTFGGGIIVPDVGSPAPPYQHTIQAPGTFHLTASGVLMPSTYLFTIFGRAEGTTAPYSASYANSLTITFEPDASITARSAAGNPDSYTGGLPILGQTWNATVDVGSTGHGFAAVFASTTPANVPLGPGLTVLIDNPVLQFMPLAAGPQAAYAFAIPANPALAGFVLFTQAVHVGGPPLVLSNALDLLLGF